MKIKRLLLLLLSFLMLFSVVQPGFVAAQAAETPQVLFDLMAKFPHKAYWNHVGSPRNNPDGVTDSPCPNHIGCSWQEGACSCNSFLQAIQCMGFAFKAAYDIVGSNPREWEMRTTIDADKLRVGDVIRYRGNRHSLCVTGVKGNVISFVDCNWYPLCQIRWGKMDLDDMPSFSYVLHDPKNRLKNKNLDFFQSMVDDTEGYLSTHVRRDETWVTNAVMNMRRRTSTDSAVETQLPAGISFIVTDKKINNDYLWGKTTYSTCEGWVALDYCSYVSGSINAPQFKQFCDVHPVNASFKLNWTAVDGADYYKVFLYDENDAVAEKTKTTDTNAAFTLNKVGAYYAEVESYSKHAESWVLTGEAENFRIQKPEEIRITTLQADTAEKTLLPGDTAALSVSVSPYCAFKGTIVFTSSDPKVVETDSVGNLLAVSCGKATVTAKDTRTGLSASCAVTVNPPAPQNLRQYTKALAEHSVTLVWTKIPQATGYYVYRRKADGSYGYIGTATANKYKDSGISDSKVFTYLVKAFYSGGGVSLTGAASATAAAVTKPEAVKNLKVTPEKGELTLKWTKNARADSYLVYRAENGSKSYGKIAETSVSRLTLPAKAGRTYSFKVRAVKEYADKRIASALCEAVTARTV